MRLPWKVSFEQSILSIKFIFAFYQMCFSYYQMYICLLTNLFVFDFLCCHFYRTKHL